MKDNLLLMSTRLKMPQPRKNYIAREELFEKLDTMGEYSVTLVQGGAGTGKTTLIASFAIEKGLRNIKWISLDESCNNVFIFWSYFIEAAGDYLGNARENLTTLFDENFVKNNYEQLLTILINGFNTHEDVFIALDDFYYVTDGFLIHTIEFFIRNKPDNVHLLLLTRQEPLLYLAALNMEGSLLMIDERDLKLSKSAGIKFLTDTLKLKFNSETLEYINSISEGWIGGLQLIAAAATSKTEIDIKKINLETKLVADYLTREIFEVLADEEQEFIVVTSILSYFNGEICEGLLGIKDFKKLMDSLLRKNILIMAIDEEKGLYRYHNILREYLKGRFKDYKEEVKIQYHLKAAEILEKLGDFDQYLDQLLLGGDYIKAMECLLKLPQGVKLFSYADRIPEYYIAKNPDFAYQCFFYYYANMDFAKCRRLYEAFKPNMTQDSVFYAFRYSNIFVEDSFELNSVNVMSISEIDNLPLMDATKALIYIQDASILHTKSRYGEALAFINKALSYSTSSRNLYIDLFSFSIKSQALEDMGELSKCQEIYKDMEKILTANKYITMLHSSFFIGYTGLHHKQMNLAAAADCLQRAADYIDGMVLPSVIGYKYNLAEFKFITGETEAAMGLVKELLTMKVFENIVYMNSLLQYVFRLNNFSGELAERFIKDYQGLEDGQRSMDSKLIYANILFYKGEEKEALELIDQILKYSRIHKIKLKLVQASLAKINMLYDRTKNKRDIINLFREALYYSCEDRILLPYYLESDIVSKVIKQYEADFYSDLNFAEKVFYKEILNLCKIDTKSLLSDRELDVLKEITIGASNKEIAESLCISLATVKTHIINIYSKLQVSNRVEAVEKAKGLGII